MPQGTIKKLVTDRGFGFIAGERGEVFFHYSALEGANFDHLQQGQAVEYEIDTQPDPRRRNKGPRASLVKLA
jgi:CspA family cold shock protein